MIAYAAGEMSKPAAWARVETHMGGFTAEERTAISVELARRGAV